MPIALPVFIVVALVHLGAQLVQPDGGTAQLTQIFLMPLLAVVLLGRAPTSRRLVQLAVVALFFSWLGDTLPRFLEGDPGFMAMIGCFLVAQIVYAVAFWPWHRESVLRRAHVSIYVVVAVCLVALCAKGAGPLLVPVIVYAAAITVMAVLASGLGPLGLWGGVLFMGSDALIALRAFSHWDLIGHGFWVMLTYLAAQVLLVGAVIERSREPAVSASRSPRRG